MSDLPRFGLGTVQRDAELCPALWGLLDALERVGFHLQSFQSAAHLSSVCGVRCITGRSQRHLDSWMMSPATCREVFEHGAGAADVSVVAGRFDSARCPAQTSSLDTLCHWLDLPAIAVVDVSRIDGCSLPNMPAGVAGIVLDKVRDTADGIMWRTWLEARYNAPVLGWLDRATQLRSAIGAREVGSPCRELCRALGERMQSSLRIDKLLRLVQSQPWTSAPERLFAREETDDPITVAVAFDEAFQGYFADTLDLLEARGARICDFSPLRSEALPYDADVVYMAGSPDSRQAEAMSRNVCLQQDLRHFVARGGRVYAEGGGLAYLCERLITADGKHLPMTDLLPAVAMAKPAIRGPQPAEITFGPQMWLGACGTAMKGYIDDRWEIRPQPDLGSLAQEPERALDLVGDSQIVGSRLQVDFAAQPHLIANFFRPRLGALVGVE